MPAKYAGCEGLPPKAPDAATMPGADPDGNIALDVDISMPTTARAARRLSADRVHARLLPGQQGRLGARRASTRAGEHWHYNNAWFASRGYVVLNYTARGFHERHRQGSTGQTQLDSRLFEINDFQYLAGLVADDSFFNVDPQKVVATGGSYGGGFAWLALDRPEVDEPRRAST